MVRVYVSIGSNQAREHNIKAALQALAQYYPDLICSPIYESPAVGFQGDDFYNLVVGFDTVQSVAEVEAVLDQIEQAQGRTPAQRKFAARTIDLDLLLYGNAILHAQGYNIPRDEILYYPFVLCPLADIAGEAQHPVNHQTYAALWAAMQQGSYFKMTLKRIGDG